MGNVPGSVDVLAGAHGRSVSGADVVESITSDRC
jgi:hypothetical protein